MAKAIAEIAVGAAAIGAAFLIPGAGIAIGSLVLSHAAAVGALVSIAGSELVAGVADALAKNQGGIAVGVTTPIGPWGYVYGTQKVGGVKIFEESNNNTGVSGSTSNNKQMHRVYCLACHPCAIGSFELHIDGKAVPMNASGSDYVSFSPTQIQQNISTISRTAGVVTMVLAAGISGQDGQTLQIRSVADNTYNGTWTVTQPNPADNTTFTFVCGGSNGSSSGGNARTTYPDYKDKIRVSFLNGNHTSTFSTLRAAGTTWSATDLCLGRTLVYVQMGYDNTIFPSSIPNLSFVIEGKNDILDPRTGTRGFTNNPALCIADYLSLPSIKGGFGLTIGTDIPTAQLIAAANICDEAVGLAAGGTTHRYTCDTFFQLNDARGSILKNLLSSCAGRISYQGGTYNIFPGAWVSPTLQLTDADIVGPIQFKPRLSIRDTCNAVKGTYVSIENDWQQADFPAYMVDADHGFVTDTWLAEDNGERIFLETNMPCTNSSAIAQRLAKIALLRTRYQMRLTIRFSLKAYQAVALDVIQLTHPRYTWVNKNFEVLSFRLGVDKSNESAPTPYVELDLAETDSSIFDWDYATEQLTPQGYKQPNNVGNRVCAPPEDVTAYSGYGAVISGITYPSTVTKGADGRVQNSIYVRWTQPNDANVVFGGHLEVQYQLSGASTWTGLAKVDPVNASYTIPNVTDNQSYNVQVRAVNSASVPSDWIATSVTVANVISDAFGGSPVAHIPGHIGSILGLLAASAISGGTAAISVGSFASTVGSLTVSCTPSPATLTGLNQSQLYWVYYSDPTFAGGTITPIATQNIADFTGVPGVYLIGSITTPSYSVTYQPSAWSNTGATTITSPTAAYDNDVTTAAAVPSNWWTVVTAGPTFTYYGANGSGTWSGFPAVTTGASMTLSVTAAASINPGGTSGAASVSVTIGGTTTSMMSVTATTASTTYTFTIPSGTNLSTVSINGASSVVVGSSPGSGSSVLTIFEIYIS